MSGDRETVLVVGGGYGGITVAKALDDVADVTLVEPRDAFVHNVAALRAAVDPDWTSRLFIPYDGLLTRGRVVRDRVVRAWPTGVELASGAVLEAAHLVLATGSTHTSPAKVDGADELRAAHTALAAASHVLLLGAGPVGLEFAGEIATAWPEKSVTVVDPADDLVSGRFPDEVRAQLRSQLAELGVEVLLGSALRRPPVVQPGTVGTFTVETDAGTEIRADLWFPCYGGGVDSSYLDGDLRAARDADGRLAVTPELRVVGQSSVYAIGDLTALPELKMARLAQMHAEVVAANIRGGSAVYEPEPDAIVLPLGPRGGVSYSPDAGVLGPEVTADIKSTFYVEMYEELLGATVGTAS